MATTTELDRLLAEVTWNARLSCVEGLGPIRERLEKDAEGRVAGGLERRLPRVDDKRRGGSAFVFAERFRRIGDVARLRKLFEHDDAATKSHVLQALGDRPGPDPRIGEEILCMAIEGMTHASATVRTAACSVIQNQGARGVEVAEAVEPLQRLLDDRDARVRSQASCAAGNLAKRKYDLAACMPQLRRNRRHVDPAVRESSARALASFSRHKHDLASAVADLVEALGAGEEGDGLGKQATGALLHHARKSPENARDVRARVRGAKLDATAKEVKKLVAALEELEATGGRDVQPPKSKRRERA